MNIFVKIANLSVLNIGVEVIFKVFPKNEKINVKVLKKEIEKEILPEKIEEEPIAFGIVGIKFSKIIEDKEGEVEKIEEKLKNMENVGEYEVVSISRLFF